MQRLQHWPPFEVAIIGGFLMLVSVGVGILSSDTASKGSQIAAILDKIQRGEPLSAADNELLAKSTNDQTVNFIRQKLSSGASGRDIAGEAARQLAQRQEIETRRQNRLGRILLVVFVVLGVARALVSLIRLLIRRGVF